MTEFDNNHIKRKQVTVDFLKTKGYPNISPEEVLHLGPEIYKLWDKEDVVPEGFNLNIFMSFLDNIYMEKQIMSMFGGSLG